MTYPKMLFKNMKLRTDLQAQVVDDWSIAQQCDQLSCQKSFPSSFFAKLAVTGCCQQQLQLSLKFSAFVCLSVRPDNTVPLCSVPKHWPRSWPLFCTCSLCFSSVWNSHQNQEQNESACAVLLFSPNRWNCLVSWETKIKVVCSKNFFLDLLKKPKLCPVSDSIPKKVDLTWLHWLGLLVYLI